MKILTTLICWSIALSSQALELDSDTEAFCQDLSVMYQKVGIITRNIVNHQTTVTPEGGPYIRKIITQCEKGVCKVENKNEPPYLKYLPGHPDADFNGYVQFPGFEVEEERAKLEEWKRVYTAVLESSPVPKNFFLKDKRAELCFEKYPFLASYYEESKEL